LPGDAGDWEERVKSRLFPAFVAAAILTALPVLAQRPPRTPQRDAELTARYDTDGDGKLSPAEIESARPSRPGSRQGNSAGDRGKPSSRWTPRSDIANDAAIQALLEEFDRNGNGSLDEQEMATLRETMRARREKPAGNGAKLE